MPDWFDRYVAMFGLDRYSSDVRYAEYYPRRPADPHRRTERDDLIAGRAASLVQLRQFNLGE
ncbi:MAG: hypothetical protein ACK5Q5_16735 [Planctomycetaceae bacterium]